MKHLGSIAGLALAASLLAAPVAHGASPVRGVWSGMEKTYWTGSAWKSYSVDAPVSFRVERGKVPSFGTTSAYVWPHCAGGATVKTKLPHILNARMRRGLFRGKRTAHVGHRKMTAYVSGRFTSARRARGTIVVKLGGCPDYRSTWRAYSGVLGGMHIPICRGEDVPLADGSYYYNPCAYIA
jgi:hypothetical protein